MEQLYELGLEVTIWLQTTYPGLADFLRFISSLGEEWFYLGMLALIYWCVDKRLGKHLSYVFMIAIAANGFFKHVLRTPRPFWLDVNFGLYQSEGYGVPSGHAQLATVFYLFIAGWVRRGWAWLLALLMVLVMGFSRIYLGAHFIHDVVVGYLIGLLVLLGYVLWRRSMAEPIGKRILGYKLMLAVLVPIVIVVVYGASLLFLGAPDMSADWSDFVEPSEVAGFEQVAVGVGALLGAGIGFILEGSRVRFIVGREYGRLVGRFLVGIIVAVALWLGLDMIFPAEPLWLGIPLRILRYFAVAVWISYYAPMTFVRLNLAEAEPEPEMDLTL